jgi:hypothetical protein
MACVFKNAHKRPVAITDFGDGFVPGNPLAAPIYERVPKYSPANSEPDEPGDPGSCLHPLAHFLWVFAAAQNDATNFVPTALIRGYNDSLAVLRAVEPFNFPNICLDTSILEFLNGLDHQPRTNLKVVSIFVSLQPL